MLDLIGAVIRFVVVFWISFLVFGLIKGLGLV